MKRFMVLLVAVMVAGCARREPSPAPETVPPPTAMQDSMPLGPAPAKITMVNTDLHFVVIDFKSRVMPALGAELDVYRGQKRIGAVKITEPMRATFATADIVEGEIRPGDMVR